MIFISVDDGKIIHIGRSESRIKLEAEENLFINIDEYLSYC